METPVIPVDPDDTLELPFLPWDLPEDDEPLEDEEAVTACTWIGGHEAVERRDFDEHGRACFSVECRFCGDPMPRSMLRDEYRVPVWFGGQRL